MARLTKPFDYVIVGAGSAGCVLANRLSSDPNNRVLLLEAGGKNRHLFVHMPAANGFLFGHPKFDWGYQTVPQPHLDGRKVYTPRGRGFGGSSAINGMIVIRGNHRDYDKWRQMGLNGWGYSDILPYFRRAEGNRTREDGFHRHDGTWRTGPSENFDELDRAFLQAVEQSGLPFNPDFNGMSQIGAGHFDVSVHKGRRWTTATAYLDPVRDRSNLTVITEAHATRLLFDGSRAVGIEYLKFGQIHEAYADNEVILSLGAIGSPQLLLLSGVGPADDASRMDIHSVIDLPGVGRNLQDHLNVPVPYECIKPDLSFARYQRWDKTLSMGLEYLLKRSGPGAAPFWSVGAFKALDEDSLFPDYQVFFTPMVVVEEPSGSQMDYPSVSRGKGAISGFQFDVNQMHSECRGTLKLASSNPLDYPLIDPQYLSTEYDRKQMIDAVSWARELASQPAFDGIRGRELGPGKDVTSDEEILEYVKAHCISGYHQTCTCKMGTETDSMSVVDENLKVYGLDALRVVDASIMPNLVTGNTNGPTIMIAEKASDLILGRPSLPRIEVTDDGQIVSTHP